MIVEAVRMEVTRFPAGYRVTFQRKVGSKPALAPLPGIFCE
jgi:hypothetical protein